MIPGVARGAPAIGARERLRQIPLFKGYDAGLYENTFEKHFVKLNA